MPEATSLSAECLSASGETTSSITNWPTSISVTGILPNGWPREAQTFLEAYTLHFGSGVAMEGAAPIRPKGRCLAMPSPWNNQGQRLERGYGRTVGLGIPICRPSGHAPIPSEKPFSWGCTTPWVTPRLKPALRSLHRRGERSFYPASEDDVYTIFLRSTPAEDRNAFEDTYFCLHGREMPALARSPACEVYTPIPTPVHRAELEIFTPITPNPHPRGYTDAGSLGHPRGSGPGNGCGPRRPGCLLSRHGWP